MAAVTMNVTTDSRFQQFAQTVDLTSSIKNILTQYPFDITIVKELVQNADDAGAKKMCVLFDKRSFPNKSVFCPSMQAFQGPALVVYNDATFTKQDLVSIRKVGASEKVENPSKTGRFGIGFNSVYHLTDLPSFVTGSQVIFFDPHAIFLPEAQPGISTNYVDQTFANDYPDQYAPYTWFGCAEALKARKPFTGTCFRLPLRTEAQAKVSRLSRKSVSEETIIQLLHSFIQQSEHMLPFLRNLAHVEWLTWEDGAPMPTTNAVVKVEGLLSEIAEKRRIFETIPKPVTDTKSTSVCFPLKLHMQVLGTAPTSRESNWLVCSSMAMGRTLSLCADPRAHNLSMKLIPWGGACVNLTEPEANCFAYCTLPMPVRTGLPVHVNGFFELSANRRDIWYNEEDSGDPVIKSLWNRTLIEDIIGPSYIQLVAEAAKQVPVAQKAALDAYYAMFPQSTVIAPWLFAYQSFYENLADAPVLFSPIAGGRWVAPKQALIADETIVHWPAVERVLMLLGIAVVHPPRHVRLSLVQVGACSVASPAVARTIVRQNPKATAALGPEDAAVLLCFCMTGMHQRQEFTELAGLPLLPMADGSVGVICERADPAAVQLFVAARKEENLLLGCMRDRLVNDASLATVEPACLVTIRSAEFQAACNVTSLSPIVLAVLMDDILAAHGAPEKALPVEWLATFWTYVSPDVPLAPFYGRPLLLSVSGTAHALVERHTKPCPVINTRTFPEPLAACLALLGCQPVNPAIGCERHRNINAHVHPNTGVGVVDFLISNCCEPAVYTSLSALHRRTLRGFIAHWNQEYNANVLLAVRLIPFFEVLARGEPRFTALAPPGKEFKLAPAGVDLPFIADDLLACPRPEEEVQLLRRCGVRQLRRAEFYLRHVLPHLPDMEKAAAVEVAVLMLNDFAAIEQEEPTARDILRQARCALSAGEQWCYPPELYDYPVVQAVPFLAAWAPAPPFLTQRVRDVLVLLGMQRHFTRGSIIKIATAISREKESPGRTQRAQTLLAYLETHTEWFLPPKKTATDFLRLSRGGSDDVSEQEFTRAMRTIPFLPTVQQPPLPDMPWHQTHDLVPAAAVRPAEDTWLVCAALHVLDAPVAALKRFMGWDGPPHTRVLVLQLLSLAAFFGTLAQEARAPLTAHLDETVPLMYRLLAASGLSEDSEAVKGGLTGRPCVWLGGCFAVPASVALSSLFDCEPFLHVLPSALEPFATLFRAVGLKSSFADADYAGVLRAIAEAAGGETLPQPRLLLSLAIALYLADSPGVATLGDIFTPSASGCIFRASALTYDDQHWAPADSATKKNFTFVHPDISNDRAVRLSVKSLCAQILAAHCDILALKNSDDHQPKESVISHIHSVVNDYKDDVGVLLELIQNAEDAGATQLTFHLVDLTFESKSLLCPAMAEWQGPALYCYNDSIFSPLDLDNLSVVGQSTKRHVCSAIGKHGVGLCSAYGITDMISIVSGKHAVFIDPQGSYLGGREFVKTDTTTGHLEREFPDQFYPFVHMGVDFASGPFKGTIFRFPLRSDSAAAKSGIRRAIFTVDQALDMLECFQQTLPDSVVFLQHISNMKALYTYIQQGEDGTAPSVVTDQIFECKLGREQKEHPIEALCRQPNFLRDFQQATQSRAVLDNRLLTVQVISAEPEPAQDEDAPPTDEGDEALEPTVETTSWVVCFALGCEECSTFISRQDRPPKVKPVPVAAAAVEITPTEILGVEGRAFCGVPIGGGTETTSFPVHISGCFELSRTRQAIYQRNAEFGEGRDVWNNAMLSDAVSAAYVELILYCRSRCGEDGCAHYSLFPPGEVAEPWSLTARGVYRRLLTCPVIRSPAGHWVAPSAAVIVTPEFFGTLVANYLTICGETVITMPLPVLEQLCRVGNLRLCSPPFFRDFLHHNIQYHPLPTRGLQPVLAYCVSDFTEKSGADQFAQLLGLPLVPLLDGSVAFMEPPGVQRKIFVATDVQQRLLRTFRNGLQAVVDTTSADAVDSSTIARLRMRSFSLYTNLCVLGDEEFMRLLEAHLRQDPQVTPEWARLFWEYMVPDRRLDRFKPFSLLPTTVSGMLEPLDATHTRVMDMSRLEPPVRTILARCGLLEFDSEHPAAKHTAIETCMHSSTAMGFCRALFAIATPAAVVGKLSAEDRRQVALFLADPLSLKVVSEQCKEWLRSLPIFEVYFTTELVPLQGKQLVVPPPGFDIQFYKLSDIFLSTKEELRPLLIICGMKAMPTEHFIIHYVLPNLSKVPVDVRESALLHIFRNCMTPSLFQVLSETPCIHTVSGNLAVPRDLFFPTVPLAAKFFDAGEIFPRACFCDGSDLSLVLKGLGVHAGFTAANIVRVASAVSATPSDPTITLERARLFVQILEMLLTPHKGEDGQEEAPILLPPELALVTWVPIATSPPDLLPWLPWRKTPLLVAQPVDVCCNGELYLVSHAYHAPLYQFPPVVGAQFGWRSFAAPCEIVCHQVEALAQLGEDVHLTGTFREFFAGMKDRIYASLESLGAEGMTQAGLSTRFNTNGAPWVYVDGRFYTVDAVALSTPVDARPFLAVALPEMQMYDGLLTSCGVEREMPVPAFVRMIERIHEASSQSTSTPLQPQSQQAQPPQPPQKRRPLTNKELEVVVRVANFLPPSSFPHGLPLPDASHVTCSSTELVVNDVDWLDEDWSTQYRIAFPDLSQELLFALGATSLRYLLLMQGKMSSNVRFPPIPAHGHPTECTPLDSLAQQLVLFADVAQSKRVSFVIDATAYPSRSLVSPQFGALQGPALCVVLPDIVVAEAALVDLLSPDYDVGARVVNGNILLRSCFEVAEALQVVSGGALYVFDPRGRFMEAKQPSTDGTGPAAKRYELSERLHKLFPDQVSPFAAFDSKHTTVLRMPLAGGEKNLDVLLKYLREEGVRGLSRLLPFCAQVENITSKGPGEATQQAQESTAGTPPSAEQLPAQQPTEEHKLGEEIVEPQEKDTPAKLEEAPTSSEAPKSEEVPPKPTQAPARPAEAPPKPAEVEKEEKEEKEAKHSSTVNLEKPLAATPAGTAKIEQTPQTLVGKSVRAVLELWCEATIAAVPDNEVRKRLAYDREWCRKYKSGGNSAPPPAARNSFVATVTVVDHCNNATSVGRWQVEQLIDGGRLRARGIAVTPALFPYAMVAINTDYGSDVAPQPGVLRHFAQAVGLTDLPGVDISANFTPQLQQEGQRGAQPGWDADALQATAEAYARALAAVAAQLTAERRARLYDFWPTVEAEFFLEQAGAVLYEHLCRQNVFLVHRSGAFECASAGLLEDSSLGAAAREFCEGCFTVLSVPAQNAAPLLAYGSRWVERLTPRRVRDCLRKRAAQMATITTGGGVACAASLLAYCLQDILRGDAPWSELDGVRLMPTASGALCYTGAEVCVANADEQQLYNTLAATAAAASAAAMVAKPAFAPHAHNAAPVMPLLGASRASRTPSSPPPHPMEQHPHPVMAPPAVKQFLHAEFMRTPCWLETLAGDPKALKALNIQKFDRRSLLACMVASLPPSWKGKKRVVWTPGKDGHPTYSWMDSFWHLTIESGMTWAEIMILCADWPTCPLQPWADNCDSVIALDVLPEVVHAIPPEFTPLAEGGVLAAADALALHRDFAFVVAGDDVSMPRQRDEAYRLLAGWCLAYQARAQVLRQHAALLSRYYAAEALLGGYTPEDVHLLRTLKMFSVLGSEAVRALVPPDVINACYFNPEHCGGLFSPPPPTAEMAFLEYVPCVLPLYEKLGVGQLSEAGAYALFILPYFNALAEAIRTQHLRIIITKWEPLLKQDPRFVAVVYRTAIVPCITGVWCLPAQVLHPHNSVLRVIFRGSKFGLFPLEEFTAEPALKVFAELGMPITITPELALHCARQLSQVTGPCPFNSELAQAASALVSTLVQQILSQPLPQNLLEEFAPLAFIPTKHPVCGEILAKFSDFALLKYWPTVFTVQPCLPAEWQPSSRLYKSLKISRSASLTNVVTNLHNITGETLDNWPLDKSVEYTFSKIFGFLSDKWDDAPAELKDEVQHMCLVPVCGSMVPPNRLFFLAPDKFIPFVFQMPQAFYDKYNDFFSGELHVRGSAGKFELLSVLRSLPSEIAGPLTPYELHAYIAMLGEASVPEAIAFVDMSIEEAGNGREGVEGVSTTAAPPVPVASQVCVPDEIASLVPGACCVHCDAPWLLHRIQRDKIHFTHPLLSKALCAQLGVPMLTQVLTEFLRPGFSPKRCTPHPPEYATQWAACVRAPQFARAARAIFCAYVESSPLKRPTVKEFAARLANCEIVFVESLESQFLLSLPTGPGGIKQVTDVTARPDGTLFFIYRDVTPPILYINNGITYFQHDEVLAMGLSKLLDSPVVLPLASLIRNAGKPEAADGWRDLPHFDFDDAEWGAPGELLPPQIDPRSLSLKPCRSFFPQDVVAWRDDAQAMRFGHVLQESHDPATKMRGVELVCEAGKTETLLASDVFRFKSFYECGGRDHPLLQLPATPAPVAAAKPAEEPSAVAPGELPPLDRSATLDALADLLAALGLPPKLEEQALLLQNSTLAAELKTVKETMVTSLRNEVAYQKEKVERLESHRLCGECKKHMKDCALDCGHMFCSSCACALRDRACPECHTPVTRLTKVLL
eukprot:TRINITY_DN862_c0_g2_i1.p1 TRINITY_DN862_c0_g2~~TRINITY_DN862_c0_g2_i1.p1  ORF type:complete len:4609 (-),score=1093.39 TRINITY_DN862_c0_g2_i1:88-13881(-)